MIDGRTIDVGSYDDGLLLSKVHDPAIVIFPLALVAYECRCTFELDAHLGQVGIISILHD